MSFSELKALSAATKKSTSPTASPAAVRSVRMRSCRPLAATLASNREWVPGAGSRATTGANLAQARLCMPTLAPTSRMQRSG
ncbi:Uncharacterised protein [Mycobacterium tuberculosis]|nr:Uncharacterised protein [Mycobacterium tuberculosis]CKR57723.1 Uncharacterised protein [Mycobacterium tuberculosis]CNV06442.1 Uncharacterised protein [Mycobacterium tuberculosis]CNV23209.1 Uncharacterised protein [Mycobacterium tuberculosis]CNW24500.1 Uncharacterised protein [Mycobacterium tuberculosis]